MASVEEVLTNKNPEVLTIECSETVYDAVVKMAHANVGSLIVTMDGMPCGIITERDYLRKVIVMDRASKLTQVKEITTCDTVCIEPGHSIEECMTIMAERGCRHLPVVQNGELVGIVSIKDLVRQLSAEQQVEIKYLRDYIEGKYPV